MTFKIKTWKDNLWEGVRFILIGFVFGLIGLGVWNGTPKTDVTGVMIVNGVPLPLDFLLIILVGIGPMLLLMGIGITLSTLHRRYVKKNRRYKIPSIN
jgi:hypothetical protein